MSLCLSVVAHISYLHLFRMGLIVCCLQQFRPSWKSDIFGTKLYHVKFTFNQFKINYLIIFWLLSEHGW